VLYNICLLQTYFLLKQLKVSNVALKKRQFCMSVTTHKKCSGFPVPLAHPTEGFPNSVISVQNTMGNSSRDVF
jgi:hypothetical protein